MFVNSTLTVGITQRVVATLVACAVVMTTIGYYNTAQAANLIRVSNTLTNSAPSELSGHTFGFAVAAVGGTRIDAASTTVITFPAGFTGVENIVDGDVTVSVGVIDGALSDVSGAATVTGTSPTEVSITGIDVEAGEEVVVAIADTRVTNPAKVDALGVGDSYEFIITGDADVGKTRVAIIEDVLVTAVVETTFDFVITGLATTTSINAEATTGTTLPNAIPFGVLEAGTPELLAQQLNVTTNAARGFVVTVEKDAPFQSSTGADIDDFEDGVVTDTPSAWDQPDGTLAFGEDGWGHWGMVAVDNNLHGAGTAFSAVDQYISVPDAPRAVFAHNGPTDGTTTGGTDATTDDIGQTIVGYKVEITPLQEAGDDYNTTLTYIATPTF